MYQKQGFSKMDGFVNEKEEIKKLHEQDIARSGVPAMYRDLRLATIEPRNTEQKKLLKMFKDLLAGKTWSVTVIGSVGNGKTTLATALVNTHREKYPHEYEEARYETLQGIIDKIKAGFDSKSWTNSEFIDSMKFCRLLVIDEMTTGIWTDYTKSVMQGILLYRHANMMRTVVIGNLDSETMKQMFNEHIISRLREGASICMKAPDMRQKGEF